MELRRELRFGLRERRPLSIAPVRTIPRRIVIAVACGLAGGIGLATPLVLYGWASDGHSALELPTAATGWLFGVEHFEQNGYAWWPIVVGAALLLALWVAFGVVFAGVADRFLGLRTIPEAMGAGLAWALVTWLLSWYTLLPIARDGAPFRETADSALFVAPNWVWILGFTALGVATALVYAALRRTPEA
jgi:hypothetical protein